MSISELVCGDGFRRFEGGRITASDDTSRPFAVVDPSKLELTVESGVKCRLVILHTQPNEMTARLGLEPDAELSVADIYLASTFAEVDVRQKERSVCRFTTVEMQSANVVYGMSLDGVGASCTSDGVFIGSGDDHCVFELTVRHNVSDCTSSSLVKGVVGGRATGEFRGLVYVAPDAQRTDAQQQSRNIESGNDAHIITKPQLEIYADDVRCSHGATVGQIDDDAVFYMRQRGLSEAEARRLQIEGFVGDITMHCPVESLTEPLTDILKTKLEKL